MGKVLNLDQLAQQRDIAYYGLKAEGLVKLQRMIPDVSRESGLNFPILIPDMFAVPVDVPLESSEIREAYFNMTKSFDNFTIVLARSSDPNEMPGIFESHSSLYDPRNPKQSFQNWLTAARKVKKSGARALIGQVLAADYCENVNEFIHRYYENRSKIPGFGGDVTGFVGNSTNFIYGNNAEIICSWGLPTKVIRLDKDVCEIRELPNTYREYILFKENHDYRTSGFARTEQDAVDIITLDNPDIIRTLSYTNHAEYPDKGGHLPFSSKLMGKFDPWDIFSLISAIKKRTETEVEIEGLVNYDAQTRKPSISIFQLREYELPQKDFTELSEVPEEKRLILDKTALGYKRFQGDLYVSDKEIEVPEDAIFFYNKGYLKKNTISHPKLIIPYQQIAKQGMHNYGYLIEIIKDLENRGVKAIAMDKEVYFSLPRVENLPADRIKKIDPRTYIIKNVTVECDGTNAQIYLN
ncbi:hypothetical protein ACFL0W_02070 [Nanoarchaeota archaeon]